MLDNVNQLTIITKASDMHTVACVPCHQQSAIICDGRRQHQDTVLPSDVVQIEMLDKLLGCGIFLY